MQLGSNSDEDDLCQSLIVTTSQSLYTGYRILISVAFLVLIFSDLPPYADSFSYACSSSLATIVSPTLSPTPTSLPVAVTPARIRKTATLYLDLVLERRYWEAYQILSVEVRAGEPFSDFKINQNYTLFSGCWTVDNILVSQLDNQNGIVNIELTNVSCDDNSPIVYYDWVIRLQLQQGHLVIVSIGLYPAAPAN